MTEPEDTLSEIFSHGTLSVPEYQRGYSWDTRNVEDLTDDLQYLLDEHLEPNKDTEHYFGTIILETNEDGAPNIVDGQQRLISITLLIHSILHSGHIDPTADKWSELWKIYIGSENEPVVDTSQQGKESFKRLIFKDVDPNNLSGELPAERNLIEAKRQLDDWIAELPDRYNQPSREVIDTLVKIIENYLIVTVHWVDDSSEAGRIFETINDRGKDLTVADKIKSYLIFVADRENKPALGDQVFKTFGEIVRRISVASTTNSQSKIDSFLKEHWRLFTGEARFERGNSYEYTEIHRKLKKQEQYASLNRDGDELEAWIETYLESLRDCVGSYCILLNPNQELNEGSPNIRRRIHERIHQFDFVIQDSNITALFIAAHQRLGPSPRIVHLLDLIEHFGFRAFEVCRANRDAKRTEFREIAYQLYYAGRLQESNAASNEGRKKPYSDLNQGFKSACYSIENAIGAYGTERSFERNLSRDDVIDGSLNDDGWNGFRVDDSILYFLLAFDASLDQFSGSEYDLTDISDNNIKREHIWPRDQDMVSPRNAFEHRRYHDSLGNLGFLPTVDAEDAKGKSYQEKYRQFYKKPTSPGLLQTLPDPSDVSWGAREIRNRTDEMVQFAKYRWPVETRAYIQVNVSDDSDPKDIQAELRTTIRDSFDGDWDGIPSEFVNLPRIDVDVSEPDFDADYVISCPDCGGTVMEVWKEDGETVDSTTELHYRCECGEDLPRPSVSFYFADHA